MHYLGYLLPVMRIIGELIAGDNRPLVQIDCGVR